MARLRSAFMLVVPSVIAPDGDHDGIPNVMLEAFACETPVIAARLPAIAEVILHARTGILVEPGNVSQLARAIRQLLEDPDLRASLATHALALVREHYDLETNAKALSGLLKGALEGSHSAPKNAK